MNNMMEGKWQRQTDRLICPALLLVPSFTSFFLAMPSRLHVSLVLHALLHVPPASTHTLHLVCVVAFPPSDKKSIVRSVHDSCRTPPLTPLAYSAISHHLSVAASIEFAPPTMPLSLESNKQHQHNQVATRKGPIIMLSQLRRDEQSVVTYHGSVLRSTCGRHLKIIDPWEEGCKGTCIHRQEGTRTHTVKAIVDNDA